MTDLELLRNIMLTENVELRRCDINCRLIGRESILALPPSPQWVVFYHAYRSRQTRILYCGESLSDALHMFLGVEE